MAEITTIGLDIAKNVFQAHGADAVGRQIFSQQITRSKALDFFRRAAEMPCGAGSLWRRALLGPRVDGHGPRGEADSTCPCEAIRKASQNDAANAEGNLRGGAATEHAACNGEERRAAGLSVGILKSMS